jgi:preprotein translocase subunit SecF
MVDFMKWRKLGLWLFFSLFLVFVGIIVYKKNTTGKVFTYSVDFTGGTQVLLSFSQPVSTMNIMSILETKGLAQPVIREFSKTELLIRVAEQSEDVKDTALTIKKGLEEGLPGVSIEIKQVDSVGSGVGASLWWTSLYAVTAGLGIMLVYILTRFWSLGFALGAVGSLAHDALVMLLFCILFNYEISISVIAAILTVLGYSINDTIIIFSRIRENIAKAKSSTPLEQIVNISINETLRRTLLTTVSTIIVLVPLIVVGGEVLRTLSVLLMVGFVFGTYSSICVASPLMLACTKKRTA